MKKQNCKLVLELGYVWRQRTMTFNNAKMNSIHGTNKVLTCLTLNESWKFFSTLWWKYSTMAANFFSETLIYMSAGIDRWHEEEKKSNQMTTFWLLWSPNWPFLCTLGLNFCLFVKENMLLQPAKYIVLVGC